MGALSATGTRVGDDDLGCEILHRLDDLALTTNGALLADKAALLKAAGLDRVTVSLDSLDPETFARMNDVELPVERVLHAIETVNAAGLYPIKINCVTMRGTNDDEAADFARLSIDRALTVRFIEYMPLGDAAVDVVPFVPLEGATPAGDEIRLAYDKATIKDAPNVEADAITVNAYLSPRRVHDVSRRRRSAPAQLAAMWSGRVMSVEPAIGRLFSAGLPVIFRCSRPMPTTSFGRSGPRA